MATLPTISVSAGQARSHWTAVAGLGEQPVLPNAPLSDLVASTGWPRTLGGVDAYLSVLARRPDVTRSEIDGCVAARSLAVSPAARNCIYLLPEQHRRFALAEAQAQWQKSEVRQQEKAGIRTGELQQLGNKVLEVLDQPLTTAEIRAALGDGAVRSLGELGKKHGISSPLPPAIRLLEFRDQISRLSNDNRIDSETYVWEKAASPAPYEGSESERRGLLATVFATACGPFTLKELASFAGISQKDAAYGIEATDLQSVDIDEFGPAFILPERIDDLRGSEPQSEENVRLLGFEDFSLVAHSPAMWFDPKYHSKGMPVWGRGDHTLGGASHLFMRTVLVGDRMAGFWAWNPESLQVEVAMLGKVPSSTQSALDSEIENLTRFLASEFGNARMTSIDSDSTEKSRLEALHSLR